jgi:hypothetical protein
VGVVVVLKALSQVLLQQHLRRFSEEGSLVKHLHRRLLLKFHVNLRGVLVVHKRLLLALDWMKAQE